MSVTELDAPIELALAHVFGEPVLHLPHDLYIPPEALRVLLDEFEGPLDLLLYLIRKQNIDILDIPMAQVTAQYMAYVQAMEASRIELAAEYLLMAAMLIEIKSRLLVPKPADPMDFAEEVEDPRTELMRRLLEYEQIKLAARALDALPQAERDFSWVQVMFAAETVARLPDVSVLDLKTAWLALLARNKNTQHHVVANEQLSVRAQMAHILRVIANGRYYEFDELFDGLQGVPLLVVTFIALLELVKERAITVTQFEPLAPIYVQLIGGSLGIEELGGELR
ncbi:segregation/condensation protein A [Deefgea chitinilytica]|uniref:Segregation and condensation protein A n=2 Tax=Chitinibacteraceae TaxID=2897177 RepID=A0ABS2C917_9NEIS|nr:segregation/condensation protein A [Deefgea chitinilytica]MBM9887875.1 segregation/condensation protein A [Deefgea sp. CFH1-16]